MTSPSPFTNTGVLLQAKTSWPFVVAKTGTADSTSAFSVYNSANTELMRVRSDGNVGIGTAAPQYGLHVYGRNSFMIESLPAAGQSGVTFIGMSNRSAAGHPYMWRWFTASDLGGSGVTPNGMELYEYPDNAALSCCIRRTLTLPATTSSPKVLTIDGAGNVGVGTTAPQAPLHIVGNARVDGDLIVSGNVAAKYQDVAEWVPASDDLDAGTVVVLRHGHINEVTASAKPYDTAVAGVVSAQPGVILGEAGASREMIATSGRVRVKVDATAHPIEIGDLLVTSGVTGTAMKSEPLRLDGSEFHRPGTIIGKALEPLTGGTGEILVLLSLQ
jgi:hypothetical protein